MKKKPFLSIDYSKPGKGVKKGADKRFTFANFFPLLKRKIWGLITTNFLWIIICFPLIFGFVALSGNFDFHYQAPVSPMWAIVSGAEAYSGDVDPIMAAIMGAENTGLQSTMSYAGPVAKVLYYLTALAVLTFGAANTGMAYITRNYTKEEYVDMPHDYVRAIKKSFWQSIFLGIIDLVFIGMIVFDLIFFFTYYSSEFIMSMFFFICLILSVIYIMARPYMYLQLVTFKLPLRKILKNSFIFAIIGFKRNLAGLFGSLLVIIINLTLYVYIMPLGGLMPFFITLSLCTFITTYAAWPNIKKIMIDPYYKSDDKPKEEIPDDAVFTDRG